MRLRTGPTHPASRRPSSSHLVRRQGGHRRGVVRFLELSLNFRLIETLVDDFHILVVVDRTGINPRIWGTLSVQDSNKHESTYPERR
jgi:hypothetical protein